MCAIEDDIMSYPKKLSSDVIDKPLPPTPTRPTKNNKPPKYESHVTGHVKPDGQIYVGRKHAGKKAEVWFLRDKEDEVKE